MLLPYYYYHHCYITLLLSFSSPTTSILLPSQFDLVSQIPLLKDQYGSSLHSAAGNANRIFNTLHSAMRQFGSSYYHNGMSLIPATVPAGITLYHGGKTEERVVGMEWLAFEIEHAEMFARSPAGRPKEGDPDNGGSLITELPKHHSRQLELIGYQLSQAPEDPSPPRRPPVGPMRPGYLHIYRTNRPLNLLYIDGMGAAKASIGTLDTQDILILNTTEIRDPMQDPQRGRDLCALPKLWDIPIDGFIRMEAGFEIIHCDFSTEGGLDFVEARKRPESDGRGDYNIDHPEGYDVLNYFEYMRGVSMRYNGIDASRVQLKFDKMISAYFYPVNLSNPDPERQTLPRLPSADVAQLERIRQDLKDILASKGDETGDSKLQARIDWQGMVDMIVARYAGRLQYIASDPGYLNTLAVVNVLLNTFINYDNYDKTESIKRCASNYFTSAKAYSRWTKQEHLLGTAILHTSRKICDTLFDVREDLLSKSSNEDTKASMAVNKIKDLITHLDWSTWRECGKCAYDEVCFISMWPFGGKDEHFHPACKNTSSLGHRPGQGNEYWERGMSNIDVYFHLR